MKLRVYIIGFFAGAQLLLVASLINGCLSPPLKELNPCLVQGVTIKQDVRKIEKVDLLFMIDNSDSMAEEQGKLKEQIPRLIKVLMTGDKTPENTSEDKDFTPAKDIHLAVVSSDMGLPTMLDENNPDKLRHCLGAGDDGYFLADATLAISQNMNCPGATDGAYPIFLQHVRGDQESTAETLQSAEYLSSEFACMATLGTGGCGFEMQLEAPLKALWPSQIDHLNQAQQQLNIKFLADPNTGSQGHGDMENKAFLRGTPYHPTESDKLSLLAIILISDEEDCSAGAKGNLDFLSSNFSGVTNKALNLRCYYDDLNNLGNKYPVDRYINGFKMLRPEYKDLVVFAAIVGIPPTIEEDANGDKQVTDDERQKFYQAILNAPEMQPRLNQKQDELENACIQDDNNDGINETAAMPATRYTEVAEGFGVNGVIRSICAPSFAPAMDAIINVISNNLGGVCLPREYTRDSSGLVGCHVIWTMRAGEDCASAPYLSVPEMGDKQTCDEKTNVCRNRCVVNQIPVINPTKGAAPDQALKLRDDQGKANLGWYYDDFSMDMDSTCKTTTATPTKQRISFSLSADGNGKNEDPPNGVSVDLDCSQELSAPSSDEKAGKVLQNCTNNCDGFSSGVKVGDLFCHEKQNVCVLRCQSNADCKKNGLAGWVCDNDNADKKGSDGLYIMSKSSLPICVNPTCK